MTGLRKPKQYDWKDSNLALFGSDTEKKVKKESAECEPAWQPVRAITEPTTLVWRMNKFKVEPVPTEDVGTFYSGDSYIILHVTKVADSLHYDAYFWIGSQSSQDEYGTAAYKTVELDNYLDDKAIQHREVDGFESTAFKCIFPTFELLAGGYDTGFRKVEPEKYEPRLMRFQILSGNHCQVTEVSLSRHSLQSGDVFIFDKGATATQWNGSICKPMEKVKAAQFLQNLENQRNGRCTTDVVEESACGPDSAFIQSLPDVPIQEDLSQQIPKKALYKMSDASGKMEFSLLSEGKAPKDLVDANDVFLIVTESALFVYIGSGCSKEEKANAMGRAHAYLKTTTSPFLPVTVVGSGVNSSELEAAWD